VLITRQQIIDIFTAIKTAVEGVLSIDGTVDSTVQNWPASQTVDGTVAVSNTERSITASALPTGAATEAKQDTSNTSLTAIKNAVEGTVDVQLTGSNAANYESVTVANTAIGLTAGTYGANIYALITCETAQIRFRIDGTNPTASEGHILNPGDILKLDSNADIAAFKAIRTGATSGVIKVSYSGVA
jgi:hypothetical protein